MVIITLEYRDPTAPSKSTKPLHPDEALELMREAVFRVACGEYAGVYLTKASPLKPTTTEEKAP